VAFDDASPDGITAALTAQFDRIRSGEIARGTSLSGPQRDDIDLQMTTPGGEIVDVRTFGSQGQQRTVALALRLAEEELLEEWVGESPIVLLDDVLSDLDVLRRSRIFSRSRTGAQTFITTTDLSSLPQSLVADAKVWRVTPDGVES
jgi:DNA replication and repair protein RecF